MAWDRISWLLPVFWEGGDRNDLVGRQSKIGRQALVVLRSRLGIEQRGLRRGDFFQQSLGQRSLRAGLSCRRWNA